MGIGANQTLQNVVGGASDDDDSVVVTYAISGTSVHVAKLTYTTALSVVASGNRCRSATIRSLGRAQQTPRT